MYCLGNINLLNHQKIVAIVGSRDCTEYGRKYAGIFAKELAKCNICVISGLAIGIDAAAHYGAVSQVGSTIAVLGGGLNHVYPPENLWLYNKILQENGCIITEHSDDEETNLSDFPMRNRIICGIADAVLVIEATHRSGSGITAKYAKKQGKKIYCIPLNLDSKNSSGINELINDGAKIVTSPQHIVSDLFSSDVENITSNMEITKRKYKNFNKELENQIKLPEIPKEYKTIYEILNQKMTSEEIAIKLNKNIGEVNSMLTIMELEGYIKQSAGNNFIRN